jgi:hypothetical protein
MRFLFLLDLLQSFVRCGFAFCRLAVRASTTIGDYNAFRNSDIFGHTTQEARGCGGAEKTGERPKCGVIVRDMDYEYMEKSAGDEIKGNVWKLKCQIPMEMRANIGK